MSASLSSNARTHSEYVELILQSQQHGRQEIGGQPIATAIHELALGHKRTHWIWYVFPQIEFKYQSETSRAFSVKYLGDIEALLNHPEIRANLNEAFRLAALCLDRPAARLSDVFGGDERKVVSSATLFAGYLDRYLHRGCVTLHLSAGKLLAAAERCGLSCQETTKWLCSTD